MSLTISAGDASLPTVRDATASVTTAVAAPDGVLTAVWKLAENDQTAEHVFGVPVAFPLRTSTVELSFDVRAAERNRVYVGVAVGSAEFSADAGMYWNLNDGTYIAADESLFDMVFATSPAVASLGDGWYRITAEVGLDTTAIDQPTFELAPVSATFVVAPAIDGGTGSEYVYEGTTGSGIYVTRPVWASVWNSTATVYSPIAGLTTGSIIKAQRSAGSFSSSDVGRYLIGYPTSGDPVTFFVNGYKDADEVTAIPLTATTAQTFPSWGFASTTVTGLNHLEGEAVSVIADGEVVASPFNTAYPPIIVSGGEITLPEPAVSVTVGLPYVVDVQTLDIDATSTTIKDREQFSGGLIAWVRNTGAFWAGPAEPASDTSIAELERIIPQDENWDAVTTQAEGVVEGVTLATRTRTGRVWVRQVDPVPMTILGIAPMGTTGGR